MKVERLREEAARQRGDHVCLRALERAREMQSAQGFFRSKKPAAFSGKGGKVQRDILTGREEQPRGGRNESFIGASLSRLIESSGWSRQISIAKLQTQWEKIVGPTVAKHASIESFKDGELTILTDSTSWATNLRNLLPHLERTIREHIGQDVVEKITVKAKQQVSWKKGLFSVPGRGVRDTYD